MYTIMCLKSLSLFRHVSFINTLKSKDHFDRLENKMCFISLVLALILARFRAEKRTQQQPYTYIYEIENTAMHLTHRSVDGGRHNKVKKLNFKTGDAESWNEYRKNSIKYEY